MHQIHRCQLTYGSQSWDWTTEKEIIGLLRQLPSPLHLESGSKPCPHLLIVSVLVSALNNNASSQLGSTQISTALSLRHLKMCKEEWPLFSHYNFKWQFLYCIVFNSESVLFLFLGKMEKTLSCSVRQSKILCKNSTDGLGRPPGHQFMNTQLAVQDRCFVAESWSRKWFYFV